MLLLLFALCRCIKANVVLFCCISFSLLLLGDDDADGEVRILIGICVEFGELLLDFGEFFRSFVLKKIKKLCRDVMRQ